MFKKTASAPLKDIRIGMAVKIVNLNQKGSVLTLPDEMESDRAGRIMKINVNIKNLAAAEEEKKAKKGVVSVACQDNGCCPANRFKGQAG